MKKKISLLLCVLVAALCFAGCSGKSAENTSSANEESMKNISIFLVDNMLATMDEEGYAYYEEMSDYELNYTILGLNYNIQQYAAQGMDLGFDALKVEPDDFRAMLNAWKAAQEECGAFVEYGDFTVEQKNSDTYEASATAEFEDRKATIAFSFDEDMNIESLDVSAKYTLGEILTKAGLNTLLGMGTVFAVLIFLAFIISLMKYIPVIMEKLQKKKKAPTAETKAETPVVEPVDETDDLELVAVISAAIAASEGTSTDGFVVRSIKRRPSNNWN